MESISQGRRELRPVCLTTLVCSSKHCEERVKLISMWPGQARPDRLLASQPPPSQIWEFTSNWLPFNRCYGSPSILLSLSIYINVFEHILWGIEFQCKTISLLMALLIAPTFRRYIEFKKKNNRRTLNEDERSVLRNRRDKRLAKWPMAIAANGKRKRGQNIKQKQQKNKRT